MKPFNPHRNSHQFRRFRPTRKPAGIFALSIVFSDASLLVLAFFLAISPFILQPGINITLPASPFTGGAPFGASPFITSRAPFDALVLSITPGGWFYFNNERLDQSRLVDAFTAAVHENPTAPLIIEADEKVLHGTVIIAWNAALEAGISKISIASRIATTEKDSL